MSPGRDESGEGSSRSRARTAIGASVLGVLAETLFVVATAVATLAWFTAGFVPHRAFGAAIAVAAASFVLVARRHGWISRAFRDWPRVDTLLVCLVAALFRTPAFVAPMGFVGADGSLQAFLTLALLRGERPAPIFLDGSSYEGSLKAHIAAAFGALTGHDDLARLLVIASVLLWCLFVASTMALARRIAGPGAAIGAGLFVALSPRFTTVFSVSSAGPYADALGLGTLALAWSARLIDPRAQQDARTRRTASRHEWFALGCILGVAFWQQPIVISFAATALGLALLDGFWKGDLARRFACLGLGLFLGRLPATIHDFTVSGAASDVVASFARGAGGGLPLAAQLEGTLTWAFPVVFAGLQGDTSLSPFARGIIGLLSAALFALFAIRALRGVIGAGRDRRIDPAFFPIAHFFLTLAIVWSVAGEGQYSRPRYFLPLSTSFAIAFGSVFFGPRSQSPSAPSVVRAIAPLCGGLVLVWNTASNLDRYREGFASDREIRSFAADLEGRGLKTGYSDFSVSGPLTMATGERITIAGLLGPMSGEHLTRHIGQVAKAGPDFYLTRPGETLLLARRLERLGVTFEIDRFPSSSLFHGLSRPVAIAEVEGFREIP